VEIIPITLEKTNLGGLKAGDRVNLECDILGKYVYNWVVQGRK
jgi:riboflavin synthase